MRERQMSAGTMKLFAVRRARFALSMPNCRRLCSLCLLLPLATCKPAVLPISLCQAQAAALRGYFLPFPLRGAAGQKIIRFGGIRDVFS